MPILIEKLSNGFMPDAQIADYMPAAAAAATESYKKKHGGLWVGGKVTVTDEELTFQPNSINRDVHENLVGVRIPLTEIRGVTRVFGFLTGIVVVKHTHGEFRFRCFGAKQVAAQLQTLVPASHSI